MANKHRRNNSNKNKEVTKNQMNSLWIKKKITGVHLEIMKRTIIQVILERFKGSKGEMHCRLNSKKCINKIQEIPEFIRIVIIIIF